MNETISAILGETEDEGFCDRLLDSVAKTGHEFITADHLLAAWISDKASRQYKYLVKNNWDPDILSAIIIENISPPAEPGLPPMELSEQTLDPLLVQNCDQNKYADRSEAIFENLSSSVIEVLKVGSSTEPLRLAFSHDLEAATPYRPPTFFDGNGEINRQFFSANALASLESVEQTATELGYKTISLPQLFIGIARQGILKDYLTGFGPARTSVIEGLTRRIAKGIATKGTSFTLGALSGSVKRYVEMVEKMLAEREAVAFDEPILVAGLCRIDSELLAGYWRSCRLDRKVVERMISFMKDDSPINPSAGDGLPDFEAIFENLSGRIIGQEQPIKQIMPIIRKWLLGVHFEGRPAGVILFMGPPGVGKTELSKELAEILYGDRKKICMIEMNQMQEKHTVSKLIGSPPSYVGPPSGQLTDWIAQQPESIILFDEIEKAHENCFQVLLRLLSEGRIQDAHGREYDATRNLIIMTSNIGQGSGIFDGIHAQRRFEKNVEDNPLTDPMIKMLLASKFSPEFIGRLMNVVLFNPLAEEDFLKIAKIAASTAASRVAPQLHGVRIEILEEVYPYLADKAMNRKQGARALRDVVDKELVDRLLVRYSERPHRDRFTVGCNGGEIEITG